MVGGYGITTTVVLSMIGKKTENEDATPLNEVRRVLEERKKDGELTYEQQLAYEHAKKFAGLEKAKEEKFKKELVDAGMSPRTAVKVMDIMPKGAMTLRQILAHENRTYTDDEIAKILAVIKEHA